jgi:hypothetical protein
MWLVIFLFFFNLLLFLFLLFATEGVSLKTKGVRGQTAVRSRWWRQGVGTGMLRLAPTDKPTTRTLYESRGQSEKARVQDLSKFTQHHATSPKIIRITLIK